jgi:hypothetical protein
MSHIEQWEFGVFETPVTSEYETQLMAEQETYDLLMTELREDVSQQARGFGGQLTEGPVHRLIYTIDDRPDGEPWMIVYRWPAARRMVLNA